MLRYVLLFLFALAPCQASLARMPLITGVYINGCLNTLDANPIELLDNITSYINVELSPDEREALVERLQQLKQKLCWRPGAGLLAFPMLATMAAGGYVFLKAVDVWAVHDLPTWLKQTCTQEYFDLEKEMSHNFINSLFHFIIIATATFVIEAEYRDTVSGLFAKERALERKIDELITLLQQ
jgi:hypothetical protein